MDKVVIVGKTGYSLPMSKRALRRAHRKRLIRKRSSHYGGYYRDKPGRLAKLVNTPTMCSCLGCGNKRAGFGPPLHELRSDLYLCERD